MSLSLRVLAAGLVLAALSLPPTGGASAADPSPASDRPVPMDPPRPEPMDAVQATLAAFSAPPGSRFEAPARVSLPPGRSAAPCPCDGPCSCPAGACAGGSCSGPGAKAASPLDACVGVSCNGGWASGTAVVGAPAGKTWVVTAKHVVTKPGGGSQVLAGGKALPASLVGTHRTADLAVLCVDADLSAVPIGTAAPGAAVTLKGWGYQSSFHTPRAGRVRSAGPVMLVDVPHSPGDSGGGYIDAAGRLVGVLEGGWRGTTLSNGCAATLVRDIVQAAPPGPSEEVIITPDGGTATVLVDRSFGAGGCANGVCPTGSVTVTGNGSAFGVGAGSFGAARAFGAPAARFHPFQRVRERFQNRPRLFGGRCASCG